VFHEINYPPLHIVRRSPPSLFVEPPILQAHSPTAGMTVGLRETREHSRMLQLRALIRQGRMLAILHVLQHIAEHEEPITSEMLVKAGQ
jgi:hypothetical protein